MDPALERIRLEARIRTAERELASFLRDRVVPLSAADRLDFQFLEDEYADAKRRLHALVVGQPVLKDHRI